MYRVLLERAAEKGRLRGTLISAVRVATEKSKKLGQG
jgi:hypothetical protein